MPKWHKGESEVERLLDDGDLERVPADIETAESLVVVAERHIATAATATSSDPEGALALAYDASRKAATALLAHQGLRPTTKGGHLAVVRAMEAQFPGVPGLRSLDRLRRRRHQAEYPDPSSYDAVDETEAQDAVAVAQATCDAARRLFETDKLGVF
jgi:HEPN domain